MIPNHTFQYRRRRCHIKCISLFFFFSFCCCFVALLRCDNSNNFMCFRFNSIWLMADWLLMAVSWWSAVSRRDGVPSARHADVLTVMCLRSRATISQTASFGPLWCQHFRCFFSSNCFITNCQWLDSQSVICADRLGPTCWMRLMRRQDNGHTTMQFSVAVAAKQS